MLPKHQIRAILFDLDGVIAFTDRYHYLAWKDLADRNGWAFDEQVNHGLRGVPRLGSLQVILDHNGIKLPREQMEKLAGQKNELYTRFLSERMSAADLYPGVVDFLQRLRDEGARLALCSSSRNAQTVLDRLGLARFFEAVVTGNDFEKPKPDPEIFLLGAQRLGVPPFHCLVFEDAAVGVEAALNAGMKCIGVGEPAHLPNAPQTITRYDQIDILAMLDTGRISTVVPEPWTIAETAVNPKRCQYWESLFALTNGYMGLRGTYEEDDAILQEHAYPGMFINGVYDYRPYHYEWPCPGFPPRGHAMLNLCDWRIIRLFVDGEQFSLFSGTVSDYRRELDMKRGVVRRTLRWRSPGGKSLRLTTTRLVSMKHCHSAAIRYEVEAAQDCRISFQSVTHGTAASQVLPGEHVVVLRQEIIDDAQVFETRPSVADMRVGMAFIHQMSAAAEKSVRQEDHSFITTLSADCKAGQTLKLVKHACFYSSVEAAADRVIDLALAGCHRSIAAGFDALLAEQEAYWAEHWRQADIEIDGAPADQQAVRFSLFHLRQSCPEHGRRSIGANGLTGDKYCGHVFWDTEMYIAPYILYSRPDLVRPLVMYRYHLLDMARRRAKEMEGRGAMYAWNSISGEECGVVYEAATAEYHLQSAIAYGVYRYYRLSGDDHFLYDYGAEIVFETARFLADRGKFIPAKGDRFCINAVCGPDEYGCAVNNNCYTNTMVQWHLRYAGQVYEQMREKRPDQLAHLCKQLGLSAEERQLWQRAADRMFIPYHKELGIHEQDDSFLYLDPVDMSKVPLNTDIREKHHPLNLWRMQVAKQADVVLLMFVHGDQFSLEQKKANYAFYEPRTCHGSSLSACIHSIVANEIGKYDEAYTYFRASALMDINDFKNNTAAGVHSACLGGTWMAVVNGFAGMRDYQRGLEFSPHLPKAWQAYRFQLRCSGGEIGVEVNGDGASFRLISGKSLRFRVGEAEVELTSAKPKITCPLVRG